MASVILPGRAMPLGATWDGRGVNFALYSETAEKVELCLFKGDDQNAETARIAFEEVEGHIWHAYIPGLSPGALYGYRVYGPYQPENGLWFNPAKLLIDPYARAIYGRVDWRAPVFPYQPGSKEPDLARDDRDDAWGMPKGIVTDPFFDWQDDVRPSIPWSRTVIYETHVRGFTALHPGIPEKLRGTYAGLASEQLIEHLQGMHVTAVELMPVHDFLDEKVLVDRGLKNYWGYNTTNYFSPTSRYSSAGDSGKQVDEFKSMVKALHRAGIEVILDVVFNHTSEGNHLGPMLSYRGIDNPTYYVLEKDRRHYRDYTGTGNSLNVRHPQVLKLIMDSLRYWVTDMHVDGFRFDLASTLARSLKEVDMLSPFFDIIYQDPVISQVKLIAEPWDLGAGGYQVGKFPLLWTEWNGEYRDTMRRFWKGDAIPHSMLANRLTGSSDLYQSTGKGPYASINFVTAHDGFSLNDLVSYNSKHNEANGEDNRDGTDNNISWNCGAEGPTNDPSINSLRERQKRNFMATLFLSQGVPMLYGGDELSRTIDGNNNAYCQDNQTNWYRWELDDRKKEFEEFVRRVIQVRKQHPVLRRRKYFWGRAVHGDELHDLVWLRCDGKRMHDADWDAPSQRCLGLYLSGNLTDELDSEGRPLRDDCLIIAMNSHYEEVSFLIPQWLTSGTWQVLIDTTSGEVPPPKPRVASGEHYTVKARSLILFRQESGG